MDKKTFEAIPEEERFQTMEGTAYYACVHRPDYSGHKKYNSPPIYVVQLGLEGEELARAENYGIKVLEPTDNIPMKHIKLKRNVKDLENPTASKPDVVDSMQNPIPEEILIGNGSKVLCKFAMFWSPNSEMHGTGSALLKTQVLELVPYEATKGDSDLKTNPDGFTVGEVEKAADVDEPFEDELPDVFA